MIKDFIGDYIQSEIFFDGTYGIEIETETKDSYRIPRFSFWDVKTDDSLRDFGKEYVLKVPLKYGQELDAGLGEFSAKTIGIPFLQDSISTSVHVHINMLPETWKTMANYLTIYTLTENLQIEFSGEYRRNNLFCLPIRSVPYIQRLIVEIFQQTEKKNYRFSKKLNEDVIKYSALNLATLYKFGSVEIRSFRGTTDIDLIKNWVTIQNNILEYARQDITPCQIMDIYRDNGISLFQEIFRDEWNLLKHPDQDRLLHPNLWYAGNIAYLFDEKGWNSLDEMPKKKKEKYPEELLERYAIYYFALPYAALTSSQQLWVKRYIEDHKENNIQLPGPPNFVDVQGLQFNPVPQPQPVLAPYATVPTYQPDHFFMEEENMEVSDDSE